MGWTVTIGEGGTAYSIAATARFDLAVSQSVGDNGDVQAVEYNIIVDGELTAASASAVATAFVGLTDEVTTKFLPRRVKLTLDGVDKYDLKPTDGFVGPFVTAVASEFAPGNGDGHWKYRATIFYRSKGNAGGGQTTAYNTATSVETEYWDGKVVRKVWKASASAANVAAAVSEVLSFAPSESRVTKRIEEFDTEARATGLWVWDARRSHDVKEINETVRISGGGSGYVEELLVLEAPEIHRKRRRPWLIEITGEVIGYVPDLLVHKPGPHLSETEDQFRDTSRESVNGMTTEIARAVNGEYRLAYAEVWLTTAVSPPSLTHDGHNIITFADPPSD